MYVEAKKIKESTIIPYASCFKRHSRIINSDCVNIVIYEAKKRTLIYTGGFIKISFVGGSIKIY